MKKNYKSQIPAGGEKKVEQMLSITLQDDTSDCGFSKALTNVGDLPKEI